MLCLIPSTLREKRTKTWPWTLKSPASHPAQLHLLNCVWRGVVYRRINYVFLIFSPFYANTKIRVRLGWRGEQKQPTFSTMSRPWKECEVPTTWSLSCYYIWNCYSKIPQTGGLNNRDLFLTVLETQSLRSRCQRVGFFQGPSSWLADSRLLNVSSHSFSSVYTHSQGPAVCPRFLL